MFSGSFQKHPARSSQREGGSQQREQGLYPPVIVLYHLEVSGDGGGHCSSKPCKEVLGGKQSEPAGVAAALMGARDKKETHPRP